MGNLKRQHWWASLSLIKIYKQPIFIYSFHRLLNYGLIDLAQLSMKLVFFSNSG